MSRRPIPPPSPPVFADALSLLVATERPPVFEFFASLGAPARRIDLAPAAALEAPGVSAALVDFGLDSGPAMEVVEALRHRDGRLPIVAVVCCAHSLTPQGVRALAAAGVGSVLDLQMNREESLRALRDVARGAAVLHLSFGGRSRANLQDVVLGHRLRRDDDLLLLDLVTRGLPDREIGLRLHLSRHTVKHRIEQLRSEVGVRNRIELAAWAGRHGFYDATEFEAGSGVGTGTNPAAK